MAINTFKNIEQKKGYRVEKKDREIFEREVRRGIFGIDDGDIIEFVLYDSSDNPLPQEAANGKTVRYIYYTDENITKYFSKVNNTKYNIKRNGAEEFFVDVEKLIKEAGYSQGIFKTSISLLNRRLGSEERKFDKAWIHEISPSRTEVRVLPVIDESTGTPNSDLQTRYNTFVSGEDFAADVVLFLDEFSAQFDVTKILQKMLALRGKTADGQGYIKLIEKEFKIDNFEKWLSLVKISFDKSLGHFKNKRYSNILEQSTFGKPTGESLGVNFDSRGIVEQLCDIAENCVNYHLPNQDLRTETLRTKTQQKTLDKVKQILKTVTSDGEFLAEEPTEKKPAIRGCRDPKAKNYNPAATVDDICQYEVQVTKYRKIPIPPPPPPPPPPAPPRPNPPSPGPPRPRPPAGGTSYTISAEPIQSQPIGFEGRIIQEIRVTVSPASGATLKACQITNEPDWTNATIRSRNFSASGQCILRLNVHRNKGAARSGTVNISADLPGNPTTTVNLSQGGVANAAPAPPKHPARGTIMKDTCLGTTRKYSLADGNGGLQPPVEVPNWPGCGYTAPKPNPPAPPPPPSGGTGGCLVGNTMVELSDGTSIPIKDIKIGASLKGFDIKTISPWNEVEDSWKGSNIEQYDFDEYQVTNTMEITDAEVYSINDGLLEASEDHKHLIRRNDLWMIQTTLQLQPGDVYMDRDKNEVEIHTISWDRIDTVYLITLNGKHTYFANNILTHNAKKMFDQFGGFDTASYYVGRQATQNQK